MNLTYLAFLAIAGLVPLCNGDATYDEILSHLKTMEGFETVGYLPTDDSGVTIGIGIDLGQQTEAGLKAKGISSDIIKKVKKYLGYKSKAELTAAKLTASNLVLTKKEAEDISKPFITDTYNIVEPYGKKMDKKGVAVLVSLRHWAGSLGCNNCKLSITVNGKDVNYLWDTIKNKTATNAQLKSSLKKTLDGKSRGSVSYNRINKEINYL